MSNKNAILTGWDKIEADEVISTNDQYSDAKDIYDIIDIIRSLRQQYHIDNPARQLLMDHVADPNAHDIAINIDGDTVLDVLYQKYVSVNGNRLSKSEFINSIFNVHETATMDDYLNQVEGLLMNLGVSKTIIDNHINSDNPHPEIADTWFPGEPIQTIPAISFQAGVNTAATITYTREGSMYCHGVNGDFVMFGEDEIPVDYLTGEALTPMFGHTVNKIMYPEDLDWIHIDKVRVSIYSTRAGIISPRLTTQFMVMGDDNTYGDHYLNILAPIIEDEVANISVYYRYITPGVEFEFDTGGTIVHVKDDVVTTDALTPHNLFILNNGWRRVDYTVRGTEPISRTQLYILKDGERFYTGSGQNKIALYLMQVTSTPTVAPPIPGGTNQPINIGLMSVANVKDRWNKEAGILNTKMMLTNKLTAPSNTTIFKCLSENLDMVINAERQNDKVIIDTNSRDNLPLAHIEVRPPNDTSNISLSSYTFGYLRGHQGYGCTDNVPHVFDYYGKNPAGYNVTVHGFNVMDDHIDSPYPYDFDPLDDTDEYALAVVDVILLFGDGVESVNAYVKTFNYFQEVITIPKTEFLINQQLPSGD